MPADVTIAFIGPLSGAVAAKGLGARNAAELAVREANARVNARFRYHLAVADDRCDPATGIEVVERLAADAAITACVAHYCSIVALETIHIFHRAGLPAVVWGAHHRDITSAGYKEIFRVSGTFAHEAAAMARFMRARGYSRWLFLVEDTHYGNDHAQLMDAALKSLGGTVVAREDFAPGATPGEHTMRAAANAGAEVVFVAAAPLAWWKANRNAGLTPPERSEPLVAAVRTLMHRHGLHGPLQGTAAFLIDDDTIAALDGACAIAPLEGGVPIETFPGGRDFARAYADARFAESYEAYGHCAYVAASLIIDAIARVGPDRITVRDTLAVTRDHPTMIGPVTFDATGQNTAVPLTIFVTDAGRWEPWDDRIHARRPGLAP